MSSAVYECLCHCCWVEFCGHVPYVALLFNLPVYFLGDPLGISTAWCNMMWHSEVRICAVLCFSGDIPLFHCFYVKETVLCTAARSVAVQSAELEQTCGEMSQSVVLKCSNTI